MDNSNRFSKLTEVINKAVEEKHIPGAVVGIVNQKELTYLHFAGIPHIGKETPITGDTIFDLASLTKVVATLPAVLLLLEAGELDINDSVHYYLPAFKWNNSDLTVKHLLTHTTGFPPEIKFHEKGLSQEESVNYIGQLKDKTDTGTEVIYSDLNFITLGKIVEEISKQPLDIFTERNIFDPLDMNETRFNPVKGMRHRIAATEFRESLNDFQWGEVHDENASHFKGVSGHAGLFSNIADLSIFCRSILNGGNHNSNKLLSHKTLNLSQQNHTEGLNSNRGLGWQLYDPPSISGQFLADGFGHTGFTGTSLWFAGDKSYAVIILTNRVHFGRNRNINRFRRIVHNMAALAMDFK